jgi:FkbM family methyltransferase
MMELLKGKLRGARIRAYKPFLPNRPAIKQIEFRGSSFVVLANEDLSQRLIILKEYETYEIECLESLIRKDDVCLDVGANIGIYSVFMARKACEGWVIAFEPLPLNRNVMAINVTFNELMNIQVYSSILSDAAGWVEFSVSEDGAYSSIRPTNRKREVSTLGVRAETVDNLFAKRSQGVDIMKIDVEGAELLVLKRLV